jgi:hypothetical protein
MGLEGLVRGEDGEEKRGDRAGDKQLAIGGGSGHRRGS